MFFFLVNPYISKIILSNLTDDELKKIMLVNKKMADIALGIAYQRDYRSQMHLKSSMNFWNDSIESVLNHVFSPNPEKLYQLEKMQGGFSPWSQIYRLTVNDQDYVVRMLGDSSKKNISQEILITKTFAGMQLSPAVHYANSDERIVITEVINHTPTLHVELTDNLLIGLAKGISTIHKLPKSIPISEQRAKNLVSEEEKKIIQFIELNPTYSVYNFLLEEAQRIREFIQETHFCHNDLNPNNLLCDGEKFWFIDWELAGKNDPLLDLATIAFYLRLSPEKEALFLSAYFERNPSILENLKIYLLKQLVIIQCSLSFLLKISSIQELDDINTIPCPAISDWSPQQYPFDLATDVGKQFLSAMLMKEAIKNIDTLRYQEAIDYLSQATYPSSQIRLLIKS